MMCIHIHTYEHSIWRVGVGVGDEGGGGRSEPQPRLPWIHPYCCDIDYLPFWELGIYRILHQTLGPSYPVPSPLRDGGERGAYPHCLSC